MKRWDNLARLAAYLGIVGLFVSIIVGTSLSRKSGLFEDAVPAFSSGKSTDAAGGEKAGSRWWDVMSELINSRYAVSIVRMGLPSLSIVKRDPNVAECRISLWSVVGYCVAGIRLDEPNSIVASAIPGLRSFRSLGTSAGRSVGVIRGNGREEGPEEGGVEPGSWGLSEDEEPSVETASLVRFGRSAPVVVVYHTHAREAYLPTLGGETLPDRAFSLDPQKGVISVGERVVKSLWRRHGIVAAHCKTVHDRDGRLGAYTESMRSLDEIMQKYPDVKVLLDIHRDSLRKSDTTVTLNGKTAARVTIVVGDKNEHWQENYAMAQRLAAILHRKSPGLLRNILKKPYTYNQMVSAGCLLIEVGGVDNTVEELNYTADMISEAVAELVRSG